MFIKQLKSLQVAVVLTPPTLWEIAETNHDHLHIHKENWSDFLLPILVLAPFPVNHWWLQTVAGY